MPPKLCSPCQEAFTTSKPPKVIILDIPYFPFHEGPWKAFQEQSDASHDITEATSTCDFCAFAVAYASSDKALGESSKGSFANFDPTSPRRKQGEPMIALWERMNYTYEEFFNKGLGLRRQLVDDLNQFDMRIFDAEGKSQVSVYD